MQAQDVARTAEESEHPDQWDGLIASWAMIEGGGATAFDWSGRVKHGTVNGAVWEKGRYGTSLRFNGVSDSVAVGNSALWTGQPQGTLSAWIFANSLTSTIDFVYGESSWVAGGVRHGVYLSATNTIDAVIQQTNGVFQYAYGPVLAAQTWYNVAAVFDSLASPSPAMRLFLNGSLVATNASWNGTQEGSITDPLIGDITNGGTYGWNGLIDDVRVYNRALSAQEIFRQYALEPKAHLIRRRRRSAFAVTTTPTPTSSSLLNLRRRSVA